jgi:hypothetical protein
VRAIGFSVELAFATCSITDLRRPSCFAAWLEKGDRGLECWRPSGSRAQVSLADLSLCFADSIQSALIRRPTEVVLSSPCSSAAASA